MRCEVRNRVIKVQREERGERKEGGSQVEIDSGIG